MSTTCKAHFTNRNISNIRWQAPLILVALLTGFAALRAQSVGIIERALTSTNSAHRSSHHHFHCRVSVNQRARES